MTNSIELAEKILSGAERLLYSDHGVSLAGADTRQLHECVAKAARRELSGRWERSRESHLSGRRVCYMSAEFLMGRLVFSNLYNLGVLEELDRLLTLRGAQVSSLEDMCDSSLGNGGLGRLAACYLDSAATHGLPVDGYGLRYRYGLFRQSIDSCEQHEIADEWLRDGDPWSVRRYGETQTVRFADQTVYAVPYDMPVPGFDTEHVATLRLWQCEPVGGLDFQAYNNQNYAAANRERNRAEDVTNVLYPNDDGREGKRLRLKQQFFLVSATLQDVYGKHRARGGSPADFARLHAVQLNDTHPVLAIPELMCLLTDDGEDFASALKIAGDTFFYTNHTVMPEALEKWDMELLYSVCPKTADMIEKISLRCDEELRLSGIPEELRRKTLIVSGGKAHMARLAVSVCSKTNGVAELHSELLKKELFAPWYAQHPERFVNVTNGVTPRRWLGLANPGLCALLREEIGEGFLKELNMLSALNPCIDPALAERFNGVKQSCKLRLSERLRASEGLTLPPEMLLDVQIKRIHEYKRQLLNAMSIMDIYLSLKDGELKDLTPTVFLFGGKAAAGYQRAKAIIRYINRVGELINSDPATRDMLRVIFVPNYNCSWAELIIPAADISEQISPAGTEASGTGNMKLMLNGAVTLGTPDGANIEITRMAGAENEYIFGATIEEAAALREAYDPHALYDADPRLRRVTDTLVNGAVPTDDGLRELHSSLLYGASWHTPDNYLLLHDFEPYRKAKLRALSDWNDRKQFGEKCLRNIAAAGSFSSDRAVEEYAERIWIV